MTDNLKPCPWCVAVPEIVRFDSDMYWVACKNNGCPMQPDTEFMHSEDEAASAWNTRTNTLESENARLRELCAGLGHLIFALNVDYCAACPRDTISHPCPVHTVRGGECLYKTDLRELGIEV